MPLETEPLHAAPAPPPVWGFWPTAGWGALILGACVLVQGIALAIATLAFPPSAAGQTENPAQDGDVLASLTLISGTAGLLLIAGVTRVRGWNPTAYVGLGHRPRFCDGMIWIPLALLLGHVHSLCAPLAGVASPSEFLVNVWNSTDSVAWLILGAVVMPPLFEETLFRGFLYAGWRPSRLGALGTAAATSLLWTALHAQYGWFDLAFLFALGLCLTWARQRTGSLWVPIAMHAANNAAALITLAVERSPT